MTSIDDGFFEPPEYGDTLGDFISRQLYQHAETGLREFTTNIFDAFKSLKWYLWEFQSV